jgi:hypothetical protein
MGCSDCDQLLSTRWASHPETAPSSIHNAIPVRSPPQREPVSRWDEGDVAPAIVRRRRPNRPQYPGRCLVKNTAHHAIERQEAIYPLDTRDGWIRPVTTVATTRLTPDGEGRHRCATPKSPPTSRRTRTACTPAHPTQWRACRAWARWREEDRVSKGNPPTKLVTGRSQENGKPARDDRP